MIYNLFSLFQEADVVITSNKAQKKEKLNKKKPKPKVYYHFLIFILLKINVPTFVFGRKRILLC